MISYKLDNRHSHMSVALSVTTDEMQVTEKNNTNDGIGIDLGVKDLAIVSAGKIYKTKKQKKRKKKLKREQRKLSRKYEQNKSKIKKGESTKGIERQKTVVAKIHHKIAIVREDYQNKISEAIANQGFNMFVKKLTYKASMNSIDVRKVSIFYPSSKKCSVCGGIKSDLRLSDRLYIRTCDMIYQSLYPYAACAYIGCRCNKEFQEKHLAFLIASWYKCDFCGLVIDRDMNAAINLKNAEIYKIAQ